MIKDHTHNRTKWLYIAHDEIQAKNKKGFKYQRRRVLKQPC